MIKNNKGYTIIELLAVIVISSIIIVPLMQGFIKSIENNALQQDKRNAASMAEGALYGFDKLVFDDIAILLRENTAGGTQFYYEFNSTNCQIFTTRFANTTDTSLCSQIFDGVYNNFSPPATDFRVFVIESNLIQAQKDDLTNRTKWAGILPEQVMAHFDTLPVTTELPIDLLTVVVWIQYSQEPDLYIVVGGKIDDLK